MNVETSKSMSSSIWISAIITLVVISIIVFIVILIMKSVIFKPLIEFEKGLLSFFKYINKEEKDIKLLPVTSHDEIGRCQLL